MGCKKGALAALVGLAFAMTLSGCTLRVIHVIIPDFSSDQVQGVNVYRLDDTTGAPVQVGRFDLGSIQTLADGTQVIRYSEVAPDGTVESSNVPTAVQTDPSNPDSIELYLLQNSGPAAGWYKVGTFNAYGSSTLSTDQTYLN